MPNYLETTVPGETRRRAHRIIIYNQDGTTPKVLISTEDRINLVGGASEYVERDAVAAEFDPVVLSESFPLVSIATGEPLGASMTGLELMVGVQSWVLYKMIQNDTPAPEGG